MSCGKGRKHGSDPTPSLGTSTGGALESKKKKKKDEEGEVTVTDLECSQNTQSWKRFLSPDFGIQGTILRLKSKKPSKRMDSLQLHNLKRT